MTQVEVDTKIRSEIAAKVIARISEITSSRRPITEDDSFADLDIYALEVMDLALGAEQEFGISTTDDEIENLRTVADLVSLIDAKMMPLVP